jgi:hypothetical protein
MKKLVPAVMAMTLVSSVAFAGSKMVNGIEVRDWEAIDSNDDNYVSPDEMEIFLRDIRATRERSGTA